MTPEYEIFKTHGITADLNCLMMRTQELAMAVNLQGAHLAIFEYRPSVVSHGGHELTVATTPHEVAWAQRRGLRHSIALPSAASSAEQRLASLRQLAEAVNALSNLLEEGKPA